jgi:hypothetical protein
VWNDERRASAREAVHCVLEHASVGIAGVGIWGLEADPKARRHRRRRMLDGPGVDPWCKGDCAKARASREQVLADPRDIVAKGNVHQSSARVKGPVGGLHARAHRVGKPSPDVLKGIRKIQRRKSITRLERRVSDVRQRARKVDGFERAPFESVAGDLSEPRRQLNLGEARTVLKQPEHNHSHVV